MDNNEITEEELKTAMDEYGNVRYYLEHLKSEKQTLIDSVLMANPEVWSQLQDIDAEFDKKIGLAENKEKESKNKLKDMIDKFSKISAIKDELVVFSKMVRVRVSKKVNWNPDILDGYATSHPEILHARNEKFESDVRMKSI